jgi:type III pantothenate kinase
MPRPERAAAVSVAAGQHAETLAAWLNQRWGIALERFNAVVSQCGITNAYRDPARLGADRWAALVAARRRTAGTACVVDAGTAVTVDALDANGMFRGGVILPGLALQRAALLRGTAGVAEAQGTEADGLARSTADAVAAGTLLGLAGAIDRLVDEQSRALGATPTIFLTGGDAPRLLPLLRHAVMAAPDLVLEGVARMAEEQ